MKKALITAAVILLLPLAAAFALKSVFRWRTLEARRDYLDRMDRASERFARPEWGPLPPEDEQALLETHKPLLVVSRGSTGPLAPDTGYLATRHPVDCRTGQRLAADARRETLKALPDQDGICLAEGHGRSLYPAPGPTCSGDTGCARALSAVEYENVRLAEDGPQLPWIFLRYQFVFAPDGLPEGLIDTQKLLGRAGDPAAWRPVDLHAIVWVVLDEKQIPVALVLSQHGAHRTYIFGADIPWPRAGRAQVVSAARSHELYPDLPLDYRRRIRATPFPARRNYLITGTERSAVDADDIVCGRLCGGTPWDYRIERISPDDPLWTFRGYFGPRHLDFGLDLGRSGPAGGRYHTWPELARRSDLLFFSYFRDSREEDAQAARRFISGPWWNPDFDFDGLVRYGRSAFSSALESARQSLRPSDDDADIEVEASAVPPLPRIPAVRPIIEPVFTTPPVIGTYRSRRRQPSEGNNTGGEPDGPEEMDTVSPADGPVTPPEDR